MDGHTWFCLARGKENDEFIRRERDSAGEGVTTTRYYVLTYLREEDVPGVLASQPLWAARRTDVEAMVVQASLDVRTTAAAFEFLHTYLKDGKWIYARATYVAYFPKDLGIDVEAYHRDQETPAASKFGVLVRFLGLYSERFKTVQLLANSIPIMKGKFVQEATVLIFSKCPHGTTLEDVFPALAEVVGSGAIALLHKTHVFRQGEEASATGGLLGTGGLGSKAPHR